MEQVEIQYRSIEEQTHILIEIMKQNKELMDILDYVESLKLPNFYIAAGVVFQTVWNYYEIGRAHV